MEFTSRYEALGIPYPEPATMCLGHCEGTGWVPIYGGAVKRRNGNVYGEPETDAQLLALWQVQHVITCSWLGRVRNFLLGLGTFDRFRLQLAIDPCDGYHFVKCPDCSGTGRRR